MDTDILSDNLTMTRNSLSQNWTLDIGYFFILHPSSFILHTSHFTLHTFYISYFTFLLILHHLYKRQYVFEGNIALYRL